MKTLGPLGLLASEVKLKKQTIERLELIAAFDMNEQKIISVQERIVPELDAGVLLRELKRYLSLWVIEPDPDYPFAPSKLVDELWHIFLMDTVKYHAFCEQCIGNFIHHRPASSWVVKDWRDNSAGHLFAYTQALLTKHYGALPPFIWGSTGRCYAAASQS